MLTPEQISAIPNNLVDLFSELETYVIQDIARRIKKSAEITGTASWQKEMSELMGMRNIEQKVASTLKLSLEQATSLFPKVAATSMESEMTIYEMGGYKTLDLNKTEALQDYIKSAIRITKGDIENITQSLGFAERSPGGKIVYNDIASFYHKELNLAHLKVKSGLTDYRTAVKDAVKKISTSGLRAVYPDSNYSNEVDVATRRAVITSVHQMNQDMINYTMKDLVPADEQYCEVTAHANARPSHQVWQGRVYKVNGSSKDYPNLVEATGLGTGEGLSGYNCKHSYFTFLPNISTRTYTDQQLKNINTPDFKYNGETYTGYEASQEQRKLETQMRAVKRSLIAYKETGLDDDFKQASGKLIALKREYKNFSNTANIRLKTERAQVQGFDRSIASKATAQGKKFEAEQK